MNIDPIQTNQLDLYREEDFEQFDDLEITIKLVFAVTIIFYLGIAIAQCKRRISSSIVEILNQSPVLTPEQFLSYSTNLEQFPYKVIVKGNINANQKYLYTFPKILQIHGNVDFDHCSFRYNGSISLIVHGRLRFSNTYFDTDFQIKKMKILGDLDIVKSDLEKPSEIINVHGHLLVRKCRSITKLCQKLLVGGYVGITTCDRFDTFPTCFNAGENISLYNCRSLTSLPSWITELGPRSDGGVRHIDLSYTGLSEEVQERLRTSDHPGIQFSYSHRAAETSREFTSIEEGLRFWADKAKMRDTPQITIENHLDQVLLFLSRLMNTAEYNNLKTREFLAVRILEVFAKMSQDHEMKDRAVDCMFHGLATCDDRIITTLDEIELMLRVQELEERNLPEEELRELGRSFLLLEMINIKAAEHVKTLTFVDELEVYLAFQIALKERFELPINTSNMIFRNCAQISDEELEKVGDAIEEACTEEKLESYLETWGPWMKLQKRNSFPLYHSLPEISGAPSGLLTCVITQEEPSQPVIYQGNLYDYEALKNWYLESGKNPMNPSEPIDLSLIMRLGRS